MPAADRSRWASSRARELDPWREHDACGVGFVARASGHRSADIARLALQPLARGAPRGAAAPGGPGAAARVSCTPTQRVIRPAPAGGRQDDATWARSLHLARRAIERRIADAGGGPGLEPFFVCSLSCRTLVYKALLTGTQLAGFF